MSANAKNAYRWALLIVSVVALYLAVSKGSVLALIVFLVVGALVGAWKPYLNLASTSASEPAAAEPKKIDFRRLTIKERVALDREQKLS